MQVFLTSSFRETNTNVRGVFRSPCEFLFVRRKKPVSVHTHERHTYGEQGSVWRRLVASKYGRPTHSLQTRQLVFAEGRLQEVPSQFVVQEELHLQKR